MPVSVWDTTSFQDSTFIKRYLSVSSCDYFNRGKTIFSQNFSVITDKLVTLHHIITNYHLFNLNKLRMKKRFTLFVVASMLFALNMSAQETEVYVTTKAEFTTAFNAHPGTPGSVTKIIIAAGKNDDGTYAQATSDFTLNVGNFTPEATACADGTIIITSNQTDIDNLPHVPIGINMDSQAAGSHFSLVVENVSFEYRAGNLASSGQIVYWNKKDCHADSIIFRNCQLTNVPRSIVRTVPPQTDGVYNSDNTLGRFVMEGCKVHNMDIISGNNWPLVYLATQTDEVTFRNNMFYNIPYSKQILTWNYCEPTGENVHVTFENNLVVASKGTWKGFDGTEANGTFSMIDVGGYLGSMADYQINNNIIFIRVKVKVIIEKRKKRS